MNYKKIFRAEQKVSRPIDEVFAFFAQAENLQRITPPLLDFKIVTPLPITMSAGLLIDYRLKVRGLPMNWRTKIESWEPPYKFVDVQLKGPYKEWHHTHEFKALNEKETLMVDTIRYEVPFGLLGLVAEALVVRGDIQKIFSFRKQEVERLFS